MNTSRGKVMRQPGNNIQSPIIIPDHEKAVSLRNHRLESLQAQTIIHILDDVDFQRPPPPSANNKCQCCIEKLIQKNFPRSEEYLTSLIKQGKPNPNFKAWTMIPHVGSVTYNYLPWATGCNRLKKLFCWPCLLFSKDKGWWNTTGLTYDEMFHKLNKLSHETSPGHIYSSIRYNFITEKLKSEQLGFSPVSLFSPSIQSYKNLVEHLFRIAAMLIHSHNTSTFNTPMFLRLAKNYDKYIEDNIPTLHANLLTCLDIALREYICGEVRTALFYAVTIDAFSDTEAVCTVRFVSKGGKLIERYFKKFQLKDGLDPILIEMNQISCGVANMMVVCIGRMPGIENMNMIRRMQKSSVPKVFFVHSPLHSTSHSLFYGTTHIRECASFFKTLLGLSSWIVKSEEALTSSFPNMDAADWMGRTVETVLQNKSELKEFLLAAIENPSYEDEDTYPLVAGLVQAFNDVEFLFLLSVFGQLGPLLDRHGELILTGRLDQKNCSDATNKCVYELNRRRGLFQDIWNEVQSDSWIEVSIASSGGKRDKPLTPEYCNQLYNSILDAIILHVQCRFSNFQYLDIVPLLKFSPDRKVICSYRLKYLNAITLKERDEFPKEVLEEELSRILTCPDVFGLPINKLYQIINRSALCKALPQTKKLARLIMTLPYSCETLYEDSVDLYFRLSDLLTTSTKVPYSLILHSDLVEELFESDIFKNRIFQLFLKMHPIISAYS